MGEAIPLPRSVYAERLGSFSNFAFSDQAAFQFRGRWGDFFRQRIGPTFNGRAILEVGCFDAAYLGRIAIKHPTTAFIGLDWKCKPLYEGAQRIAGLGLSNVALLRARGSDLLRIFAEREVNEVWLFHPDVSKEPESKSGLISESFVNDVHRILADTSSVLSFKSDHPGYYQFFLELFDNANIAHASETIRNRFDVTMKSANFWQDAAALAHTSSRCFSEEMTLYESRFTKKRQPIYYFEIRKK